MSDLAYRIVDDQLDENGAPARVGIHYHLSCLAGAGRVVPSPFEGWATFTRIFQARPDGLRFAIARQLCLVQGVEGLVNRLAPDWICWDLYHEVLAKVPASGKFFPPPPIWRGPTEDALVMRAVHHG